MKQSTTEALIVMLGATCFALLVTLGIILSEQSKNQAEIKLNETIANATLNGYNYGIYSLASEQTKTGNIYYLNQSGSLEFKSLKELCGIK